MGGGKAELLGLLLRAGAKIDGSRVDKAGFTALTMAITQRKVQCVMVILAHARSIVQKGKGSPESLRKAVETIGGNYRRPQSGHTPLAFACLMKAGVVTMSLAQLGCDVLIPDKEGNIPLHHAARIEDYVSVDALLKGTRDKVAIPKQMQTENAKQERPAIQWEKYHSALKEMNERRIAAMQKKQGMMLKKAAEEAAKRRVNGGDEGGTEIPPGQTKKAD